MIYEATTTSVFIDKKGNDKVKRQRFVVDNMELFTDVEQLLLNAMGHERDFDVIAIKRSRVNEIANSRLNENDSIWIADLQTLFIDDEGNEKAQRYQILFFAQTFDGARTFMAEYVRQGYDMQIVSIKKTNFVDVL